MVSVVKQRVSVGTALDFINWKEVIMSALVNRFKEPSSWAGIAVLINVFGSMLGLPVGSAEVIVQAGAGVAAAAAFFLKEKKD